MKQVVCLYNEGIDVKLVVMSKNGEAVTINRVISLTMPSVLQTKSKHEDLSDLGNIDTSDEISFDSIEKIDSGAAEMGDSSDISQLQTSLSGLNIKSLQFIPIVGEPIVNYHLYEGPKEENKKKLLQAIVSDIQNTKGITVPLDLIDFIEFNENTLLSVFIEGDIAGASIVDLLASYNKRRYLKIPTVKPAELALAYYVGKTHKFFPEDNTLIIHIGKEYSKLIFLEGQKLKHIGATLDIGTKNLHTYDVYFSKILLEMENGAIPKLDNIILCGEDRSENLILSFYGTFPEANVFELKFEGLDTSSLTEPEINNLALYAIPLSVGVEYFDELDKTYTGINFLPKYIQERQKFFQFGWHSYAMLPLLFGATFFFTFKILSSYEQMKELDLEIERLNMLQLQNQALLQEITPLDNRIRNFDATQAILDSASAGAGIWNKNLNKISDFIERRRNFWISRLEMASPNEIKITGYSLSRSVLTEFSELYPSAIIKNINFETIREKNAFSFVINFKLEEETPKTQ
ncbi:hypothetical protein [Rosettibacter firmus]|uniref:hypothetical protein n=1 Tax=Rosettibacter firmus TaxID=3111522 RepID=UPI00336BC38D